MIRRSARLSFFGVVAFATCAFLPAASAQELCTEIPVARVAAGVKKGDPQVVPAGPGGEKVMRFDEAFSGRVDLNRFGVDPRDYDLLKVEVKADRGAFVRFSLENYPGEAELSHWYVLDKGRGKFGWRTIWIDLRLPEEIKPPGYKGMAADKPGLNGLRFMGRVADMKRSMQGPGRRIWIGGVRFVRKAVDLDWDQRVAPYEWKTGEPLTYSYPLTVTNRLEEPATAVLSLVPHERRFAAGRLSETNVPLEAGETKEVTARISLPDAVARRMGPLYCERFEARARAEGVPDSEVTILRSADPIHLPVTVPIPEAKLNLPFLQRRRGLPDYVQSFDAQCARKTIEGHPTEKLLSAVREKGWQVTQYRQVLNSAAFLYDHTGEEKYLDIAKDLLRILPDIWERRYAQWERKPVRAISDGILSHATLSMGWHLMGTQRSPYNYGGCSGNDARGGMSGVAPVFDLLWPRLSEEFRQEFIRKVLLPAAIQCRNHYIGPGNQQMSAMAVTLYGGLAARNWPLVSFAYSSQHGLLGNLTWAFDDDGLSLEGHYQTYTIRPILWMTETLRGCGFDLYNRRLYQIIHSRAAKAVGHGFGDPILRWVDENRFAGKDFVEAFGSDADGYHGTAVTVLRWGDLEVSMNWATHIMRGARDRCALTVRSKKTRRGPMDLGGGSYTHSSFGQSIIIIDEKLQNSAPATVLSHDVRGPVQHVMAAGEKHYPGSRITRTFALVDGAVLVFDRVENDRPRTVDWCLNRAGRDFSIPMEEKEGSWTDKPGDVSAGVTYGAKVKGYRHGRTDVAGR